MYLYFYIAVIIILAYACIIITILTGSADPFKYHFTFPFVAVPKYHVLLILSVSHLTCHATHLMATDIGTALRLRVANANYVNETKREEEEG